MAKYEPTDRSRSDTGGASGANPAVEIDKLRKAMVQQMGTSNKLVQAVFAIDRDYFGSRFQGQAQEAASTTNPFSEIEVATRVVETLAEELQGATAFADSPVLRDGVHNLVASIEVLRKAAIEIEKSSLEAVGLPTNKVALEARQFPDNNPLACINQAIGFNHELVGIIGRLLDRVQGLKLMLHEAERARSEAEEAVTPVNTEQVAGELTRAVQERDAELAKLRAQAGEQQEQADAAQRELAAQVDQLQAQLDQEHESRQADVAEVRSLAAEVSQLASIAEAGAARNDPADDLIITGSVLRDALSEGAGLAQMATAAEAVLIEWAAYVNRRLAKLQAEVEALRAQGKDPGNVAALAGDLAALRAEAERERQQAKEASGALARANQERQALERKLAETTQAAASERSRIEAQLAEAKQALAKATADQQAGERRLAEAQNAKMGTEKLGRDLSQARSEAEQAKEVLRVATADKDRALAEVARLRTQLQHETERLRALEMERDKVRGELTALTRKQPADAGDDKPSTEVVALRAQGAQAAERLKGLMGERDKLASEVSRLRALADQTKTIAEQERQRITADFERVKAALADKDRLTADLARARTQADQAKAAADQARAQADQERLRVVAEQERGKALAVERDKLAGEVARYRTLAEQAKANADQARVNADQARTLAEQARAREAQLNSELAKARDQQTATATSLYQAQTEKAALLRERDAARSALEDAKAAAQAAAQAAGRREQEGERQLATLREQFAETRSLHASLVKERDDLKKHLDEFRRSTDLVKAQADERNGALSKELTALRASDATLRGQLAVANADLARQQQRAENLAKDLDAARAAVVKANDLGSQVEALTQERTQFKAAQLELQQARANLARSEAESKAARDQIAELKAAQAAAASERTAWSAQRADLQAQIDSGKLVATATAGERDRLRRDLERLQGEHAALAKRFEERESQLTARLTETSRQLGELKQANVRLASEQDQLASQAAAQAREAQRGASEAAIRESTGVWHKRVAEHAATAEEHRSRANALEQKLVDSRKRIAELEERCARQEAGESHQRQRTGELEKRLIEADRARADAAKATQEHGAAQGRLAAVEAELARWRDQAAGLERRLADNAQLLRDARVAVEAARRRQEETDAADRAIIADLMRELEGKKKAAQG